MEEAEGTGALINSLMWTQSSHSEALADLYGGEAYTPGATCGCCCVYVHVYLCKHEYVYAHVRE